MLFSCPIEVCYMLCFVGHVVCIVSLVPHGLIFSGLPLENYQSVCRVGGMAQRNTMDSIRGTSVVSLCASVNAMNIVVNKF